ncbi:hypothetical protein [Tenacibaculum finnmarkense]|uniref:hypothetical protein n=1 Tax=Tenacibaculum finnmarkense TaxID=2781243 RepID=UPI00207ACA6C|nr:hypothetical protein [Tenacibaculum finnmarkense]MCM8906791.1 hypothetical protein [Tenacibaculum finnmarkense genomovar finnmarkense]
MSYDKHKIHQFANEGIKVQWLRDDNQKIQQDLTFSDYDFLIRKKKGKLLLKPIEDLLVEVLPGRCELDKIICQLDNVCDAYRQWALYWQELRDYKEKMMQAPYELIERLAKEGYDVFNWISSGDALDVNKYLR